MIFDSHEPTASELASARHSFRIEVIGFDLQPIKLDPSELIARYHRVFLRLTCLAPSTKRPLFITVRRAGSKLSDENFYTVPFFADGLEPGMKAEYEVLSFDSFAVPFKNIEVEMCNADDYAKRRVSSTHLERAKRLTLRKDA